MLGYSLALVMTKRWAALSIVAMGWVSNSCAPASATRDAMSGGDASVDAPASDDGGSVADSDATASDAAVSLAAMCTDMFGSALTNAFGRADGTVLAVLRPTDQQCPRPNSTHVIVELVFGGAAYRMVVNIQSTRGTPNVFFREHSAPLAGPAFSEGWHPGVALDYASTLSLHSADFTEMDAATVTERIASRFRVGAPVSIFATSSGGDSAHLVHRNASDRDGAIVIDPDRANPTYLLFRFAEQSF